MCGRWSQRVRKKPKNDHLRQFAFQEQAMEFVRTHLSQDFDLFEEVGLISSDRRAFKVDAIAICKELGYVIGLECKASSLFPREFADAFRQAIDYRDSVINDPRMPDHQGQLLDCCLVCPDWDGLHEDGTHVYSQQAEGMRLLAMHFRVGVLRINQNQSLSMVIGPSQSGGIWHSNSGWTGNALGVLRGKKRRGSGTKIHEPRMNPT
jgi:hypothetical protein